MERTQWFESEGFGYFIQQQTNPQTINYSLADSPVGLLAWIYEKLVAWTDNYSWQDDEGIVHHSTVTWSIHSVFSTSVLTWISVYWFSRAEPGASTRIYYEYIAWNPHWKLAYSHIPMGVSYFPKEVLVPRKP